MSMKKYYVEIYGRANTILTGIRYKKLYSEIVISNSKNKAKEEALNDFYMFIDEPWKHVIRRHDIKVECEYISWLVHDDRETIYINEMLK